MISVSDRSVYFLMLSMHGTSSDSHLSNAVGIMMEYFTRLNYHERLAYANLFYNDTVWDKIHTSMCPAVAS